MKEIRDVNILVTGATGFMGSHLTRKLVALGGNVSIILRNTSDTSKISDIFHEIDKHNVDMGDVNVLRDTLKNIRPKIIFHLAAYTDVSRTFSGIEHIIESNIRGTINLLHALEGIDLESFVNTGTCEEYGDNPVPFHEDQLPNPVSPYSASKTALTFFCKMLHKTMGYPIVTLRPFLSYGPYQDQNRFISQAITAALKNNEFKMTAGEQTREFNYISDIVDGFIKASITKNAIGETINIGNGVEYQIKDVINRIFNMVGSSGKLRIGALPYRVGEARHFYCNNTKAREILNWEPVVDLDSGLKMTIEWYQKNMVKNI